MVSYAAGTYSAPICDNFGATLFISIKIHLFHTLVADRPKYVQKAKSKKQEVVITKKCFFLVTVKNESCTSELKVGTRDQCMELLIFDPLGITSLAQNEIIASRVKVQCCKARFKILC